MPFTVRAALSQTDQASAYVGSNGSTQTLSISPSGSNIYVLAGVVMDTSGDHVTNIDACGTTMTRLLMTTSTQTGSHLYIYGAPLSLAGSCLLTFSFDTIGQQISIHVSSFKDAQQTAATEASGESHASTNSLSVSASSISPNTILFGISRDQSGGESAGANTILVTNPQAGFATWMSSSVNAATGTHTLVMQSASSVDYDGAAVVLSEFVSGPTPPFSVSQGGTGASSFTLNGVLFGNGTSSIQATASGIAYQVLRVPSGGGAPSFGTLDLTQSAAITGVLSPLFGGTGATSTFSAGSLIFAGLNGIYSQNNNKLFWDNTNFRLGIGTSTPASRLEVNGTAAATHFKGTGSAPAIGVGTCAGTGGTASLNGTDSAGTLTLTTGSATPVNANCFTVTYATAYGSVPHIVFSPSNGAAAALSGAKSVYASSTASSFTFVIGSTSLSNATTYKWEYSIIE